MSKYRFLIETIKGNFVDKKTSEKRLSICKACKLYENGICSSHKFDKAVKTFEYNEEYRYIGIEYNGCGCILGWKTKLINEICPIGKWGI